MRNRIHTNCVWFQPFELEQAQKLFGKSAGLNRRQLRYLFPGPCASFPYGLKLQDSSDFQHQLPPEKCGEEDGTQYGYRTRLRRIRDVGARHNWVWLDRAVDAIDGLRWTLVDMIGLSMI